MYINTAAKVRLCIRFLLLLSHSLSVSEGTFAAAPQRHEKFAIMAGQLTNMDLLVGVGGLVAGAYFLASKRSKTPGSLPPGPKPLPLIGNMLDLPKGKEWEHWVKHKELYGE